MSVAELFAQGAADVDVEPERLPADLHLERGDAVGLAHPLGLGDHLRRLREAEHVADPHAVGVAAEQVGDGLAEGLADGVPDGHVDG